MLVVYPNEEWKEVEFEEGALKNRYAVSNYGRMASYKSEVTDGTILKGGNIKGYTILALKPFGKRKTFYLHKLVAERFVEKDFPEQNRVLHLDFDKQNNRIENLRWASAKEQAQHNLENPLVKKGHEKIRARKPLEGKKLTSTEVMRIKKKLFDPNRTVRSKMLAKEFNITEMQISRIRSGRNWGHITVPEELELRKKQAAEKELSLKK